jgi:hypothetical protein
MNPGTYLLILVLATIAAAIVLVWYRDLIWPTVNNSTDRRFEDRQLVRPPTRRRNRSAGRSAGVQSSKPVQVAERLPNAVNVAVQGSSFNVQGSSNIESDQVADQLTLTTEELKQLTHSIVLYARLRVEQPAIEEAFNVRKGGSKGWRRAKMLFDLANAQAVIAVSQESEKIEVTIGGDHV